MSRRVQSNYRFSSPPDVPIEMQVMLFDEDYVAVANDKTIIIAAMGAASSHTITLPDIRQLPLDWSIIVYDVSGNLSDSKYMEIFAGGAPADQQMVRGQKSFRMTEPFGRLVLSFSNNGSYTWVY